MVVFLEKVGNIEKSLTRTAITDPGPRVAADPVVLRKACAQQGNLQAISRRCGVGVGDDELCVPRQCLAFKVFQIADAHRCGWHGGQRDAQEAGHEVGIHHRVLQLRPLPVDFCRHRLAGDLRQYESESVAGIQAEQVVEAVVRYAGALTQ